MERKGDPVQAVKSWLFPAIVTVLSTVIWMDVTELKNDVKQLLAQTNIDKTRIESLQKQVDILNQRLLSPSDAPGQPLSQASLQTKEFILVDKKRKIGKSQYFNML